MCTVLCKPGADVPAAAPWLQDESGALKGLEIVEVEWNKDPSNDRMQVYPQPGCARTSLEASPQPSRGAHWTPLRCGQAVCRAPTCPLSIAGTHHILNAADRHTQHSTNTHYWSVHRHAPPSPKPLSADARGAKLNRGAGG